MSDYTHILVAVDFSSTADLVVAKASEIAQKNNSKISLLHVVEFLPPIDVAYEPVLNSNWIIDEDELLKQSEKSLKNLCQKHDINRANSFSQMGVPKHEIVQFANSNQCDLLVVGSHGRHGLSLLLGSTANAILHAMPCDVLTVQI